MYNNCVSSIALKEGGYTKKKKGFIKTSVINCEVPTESIPSKKVSFVTVKYESIVWVRQALERTLLTDRD